MDNTDKMKELASVAGEADRGKKSAVEAAITQVSFLVGLRGEEGTY